MSEIRRKFDEDFKIGAVRIVRETGKPITQVAQELGINEGTLGNWCAKGRRARGENSGVLSEDERAELERLRKENAELAMQRDDALCFVKPQEGGFLFGRGDDLVDLAAMSSSAAQSGPIPIGASSFGRCRAMVELSFSFSCVISVESCWMRWASSRRVYRVAPVRSVAAETARLAQWRTSSLVVIPARPSRSVGSAQTTTSLSWLIAWVRDLIAEALASLNSRSISTAPSPVFAVASARPDSTARAAASASTVSVLPRRRRVARSGLSTSITATSAPRRWRASALP